MKKSYASLTKKKEKKKKKKKKKMKFKLQKGSLIWKNYQPYSEKNEIG